MWIIFLVIASFLILYYYSIIGTVPSSLCDITYLHILHLTDNATNPLLTRSPMCLTTVNERFIPPNIQEGAICSFIAATNIESIPGKLMWSCTSNGLPSTDPCSFLWYGIGCNSGAIAQLFFNSIGLAGILMFFVSAYVIFYLSTLVCRCLGIQKSYIYCC